MYSEIENQKNMIVMYENVNENCWKVVYMQLMERKYNGDNRQDV